MLRQYVAVTLLDKYVMRTVFTAICLASLLVLGVDGIFTLVREMKYVGHGEYSTLSAFEYVMLTLPRKLYTLFPMISLLGSVMGLSILASHSELIAMRSARFTLARLVTVTLLSACIGMVFVSLVGEWVLPVTESQANLLRAMARGNGQAILTAQGIWLKDNNSFIYINSIGPKGHLLDVIRYDFDANHQLQRASAAVDAIFAHNKWQLSTVKMTQFGANNKNKIESIIQPHAVWHSHVDNELLKVLVRDPEDLSMRELWAYINYLHDNTLESQHYRLAFWKKAFQPLAILAMVFLAIPFILGPLRQSSAGFRLLVAMIVGFGFYVANALFGPLSIVYHLPPYLAALLPSLICLLAGGLLLRQVR